ncbi:MAG TPA: hypothetical protein VMT08_03440 [Bradyrhizobium sp.]|nr:hypothetical protein [Bradyrhizobium sp.]
MRHRDGGAKDDACHRDADHERTQDKPLHRNRGQVAAQLRRQEMKRARDAGARA